MGATASGGGQRRRGRRGIGAAPGRPARRPREQHREGQAMRGATLALSWEIVARLRWLYYASGVYFAVACAVVALVPVSWRVPELGGWLASPLLLLATGIATNVSFSEGSDLRTRRSGFTRRLLTLPASKIGRASCRERV